MAEPRAKQKVSRLGRPSEQERMNQALRDSRVDYSVPSDGTMDRKALSRALISRFRKTIDRLGE